MAACDSSTELFRSHSSETLIFRDPLHFFLSFFSSVLSSSKVIWGGKIINFFKGYASNRLVPKQAISHAYSKVLLDTDFDQFDTDPDNRHPLSYGTDPGNLEVRQTISTFLGSNFGISPPNPDCINLTCGASFGIGVVLNRATDPSYTERVFIVTPCYFLINPTFIDAGFSGKIE